MSICVPAPNGTTILIGRSGYVPASAAAATAIGATLPATAIAIPKTVRNVRKKQRIARRVIGARERAAPIVSAVGPGMRVRIISSSWR